LKKPSVDFFKKNELDIGKMKKDFIILEVNAKKGKEDVIGAKLLKVFNFLKKSLLKEGFEIKKNDWNFDKDKKAFFYLKIPKDVDKYKIIKGPNTKFKDHVRYFKKKYKQTFVKKNVVFAKKKRRYVKAKDFIRELLKDEYVKERVKDIKIR
jgi:tRNA nucleotidyltransferase (CCA-adding enzyme)